MEKCLRLISMWNEASHRIPYYDPICEMSRNLSDIYVSDIYQHISISLYRYRLDR